MPKLERKGLSVLPKDGPDGRPGEMLYRYLLDQCKPHFEARRRAVAEALTPEAFAARQKQLRERFLSAIGSFPWRTELNPQSFGCIECDGYRIEKIAYESRARHHVTANLYVPAGGQGPYPGVLVPCGHSENGKACENYQALCALLARSGFVALCYDPIGQGERYQMLDEAGKPIVGGTTEHSLEGVGALLVGWSTATYRIWDGIRSLDYLVGRPEVDATRIVCTGNSGGGTMTSYLMALDDRIYAAAPSCYLMSLERLFETIGPQDAEQNIPGQVALGIEHADYIAMHAPKPVLVCTATRDFFEIGGAWNVYREAKRLYSALGCNDRIDIIEVDDEHGFTKPRREAVVRWMRRWLVGDDRPVVEPPLTLRPDGELQVTQTGQVVSQWHDRTVWDMTLHQARLLAEAREEVEPETTKADLLGEVRGLIGLRPRRARPTVENVGGRRCRGYRIEKLIIRRPGEVPVPALLFVPERAKGKRPATLYIDCRGKHRDAAPNGPILRLVGEGEIVLSIDVRGFGETTPSDKPQAYFGRDFKAAFVAFHIKRPLLGQRVEDALAALDVLAGRGDVDPKCLRLVGVGRGGPIALHAAALDRRVAEVAVRGSIASWLEVVATPLGREQLTQVVPGALICYDLPDLVPLNVPGSLRRGNTPQGCSRTDGSSGAGKPRRRA
jgi:cephalosporin-C deacetylase-like acetyl esterase